MANIALDIKANTSKALGEFKKLSRELDNKFLVQGLKLDVVKNAFRQINKEFEQSLGNQGFKTSETTNQLQRNAAANLAILNKMSFEAASQVTRDVKKNLQGLQAEAKITGDVVKESLVAASFFDFSGSEEDVKRQFKSFANQFATVSQDLNDSFGKSGAGDFQKVLTGQASVETLYGLDFGQGGATSNLLQKAIRDNYGNIDAVTGEARTALIKQILRDFQDVNTDVGEILQNSKQQAKIDDPFRFINREISSLFSPLGVFGSLREIGGTFENLNGDTVPRNVLQLTAELIRTIFDKDKGLFATLAKSLGEVFNFKTKNILEPILRGIEFLTGALTSLRDFLASPLFKNFLGIFKPLVNAIKGIEMPEKLTAEDINKGVSKIFDGIRGLLSNLNTYISNVDTKVVGDIVGNFLGEIINTLPDLIAVVFTSIGKAIDFVIDLLNSDGIQGSQLGSVLASVANGIGSLIGKTFQLIGAALPKIVGGALSGVGQLDGGGKLLLGGAIAEGLTRLFTGKGILGNLGDTLSRGKSNLASRLNPFSKVPSSRRDVIARDSIAARGSEQQRWGRLYQYLDRILNVLGGESLDGQDFDRDRGRNRSSKRRRDRRARQLRDQRRKRDIRNGTRQTRFSRINNRFRKFGGLGTDALRRGTQAINPFRTRGYTNPIGPLPLNSQAPYAATRGGGFTPRLESALRPSRFTTPSIPRPIAVDPSIARGSRALADISKGGSVARGMGLGIGNPIQRTLIGTRSSDVASRFASRYGTRGILSRGAGRLGGGLLQGALTVGALASIFGGGSAQAAEIDKDDSLSAEEKEFYKAENQKRTREEAGKAVIGAAGGVLGGAVGSVFGPAGTIIGGMLGSVAGELVANVLPAPITEGVGKLAEDIGKWFSGVWSNVSSGWNSATKAVGDFFGKEGPIQRLGRFVGGNLKGGVQNIQNFFGDEGPIQRAGKWFGELGGKIMGKIEEAWNGMLDNLTGLPLNIILTALGPIGSVFRGVLTTATAEREKQRKESDVNFSGGFNYIGGRNSFNEYEGFRMPDGVTFIPITGSTSMANLSGGGSRSNETTNNISITVNGAENPQEIARQVVTILDDEYSISSNQATT